MRRRRRGGAGARFLIVSASVVLTALLIGTIAAVGYVLDVARSAPSLSSLRPLLSGGSSQVLASDGTRLGFIQSDIVRTPVGWSEIPANLKNATVAIEDQRFYKHDGVDFTGIFRAAVKDALTGAPVQGASTITMQLMRNLYLGGDQHTLKQKIIEAKLALDYEKRHHKHYILTEYLNSVPYGTVGGQTMIGVQAAARTFFDKPASQLDLAQSALLAGLRRHPRSTTRSPARRPHANGATRCSPRWPNCTTSPLRAPPPRRRRRWRSTWATSTPSGANRSSSNTCASSSSRVTAARRSNKAG